MVGLFLLLHGYSSLVVIYVNLFFYRLCLLFFGLLIL